SSLEFLAPGEDQRLAETMARLKQEGFGAVAAAEGFSVDDPAGELKVMRVAREHSLPACGTHEMSGLYGLRVRTRTAVLNASILPRMIETAEMTGRSLRDQGVQAPLMVMRSDGGVMSLEEVRRRPVMTLLSGPAAGIAAALIFLRASDALFLEVGGTSTDVCLIKDGRAAQRSATVGGHPTYLKTLDSRTLGIAGGSMVGRGHVGPRSAHLAGFRYASFCEDLPGALTVLEVSPLPGDPEYLVVQAENGERAAVTTTCAANFLGYVRPGDYGYGNPETVRRAMEALAAHLAQPAEAVARQILERAAEKVLPTLRQLIDDYRMKDRALKIIGGGGGAGALVPFVAEKMGLPFEIAQRAEVISAVGAALAMVRETLEKNVLNPTEADLAALRAEVEKAVVRMGADPTTVQVTVEVDAQRNLVRATATGSVEFAAQDLLQQEVTEEERLAALRAASPREESYQSLGRTDYYFVYRSTRVEKALFNLIKRTRSTIWLTDGKGNVKLQVPGGQVQQGAAEGFDAALEAVLQRHTSYGDAGAQIPPLSVVAGRKLVDLTALQTSEQVKTLARQELNGIAGQEPVFFVIHPRA
ncbi:MAG: hydantoinase/oxoprolinase family protein, partial [Candidatus Eremiobacterota bacterium]